MQPGNYVVGFFRGIDNSSGYAKFRLSASLEPDAFVESLNFEPFNRQTGAPTLDPGVQLDELVLVRVFQQAKTYQKRDEGGVKTNETAAFIARSVISCEKAPGA